MHANCQGEVLLRMLGGHDEFVQAFDCRLFTNYIREPLPADVLAGCDVFLYQYLGDEWGELASNRLLSQLGPKCVSLCIPNYFCRTYWPLEFNAGKNVLRDRLLEDIRKHRPTRKEFIHLASRPSLLRHYDLQGIVERSLAHERGKEVRTPIKYLDRMISEGRKRRLFHTINHPGEELLVDTANQILDQLGLDPSLVSDSLGPDDYYTALDLPVHPGLAEIFSLEWLDEKTTFNLYGYRVNYAQFVLIYSEYRDSGVDSFIKFMSRLHGRANTGADSD